MLRSRAWRRIAFQTCALVGACESFPPLADFALADPQAASSNYGWREIYGGVDATRDQWLAYSGVTVAPWSKDIYGDGWRLRVGGGYGRYSYERDVLIDPVCGTPLSLAFAYHKKRFDAGHSYAEALVGYYLQLGALTAKAFAGAAFSSNATSPPDPENAFEGTAVGGKAALELWYNIDAVGWTSLDASFATSHEETSARWRAGVLVTPKLSIGPELRYDNNLDSGFGDWTGAVGGFIRYQWGSGEVSLAGGAAGQSESGGIDYAPYGTLNILYQY